jgi:DNA invertase Pin-like site-specific DNA recombinase
MPQRHDDFPHRTPSPHRAPAAGYLRRSTDKQDASIADQTKAVQQYADEHGYQLVRWYTDDAISGDATEDRAAFQHLHEDAIRRADFKVILCWDQDRFGRFDSIEAGYWIHPLRKAGVRLVTVVDGPVDWDTFTGRVMNLIKQEGHHEYLQKLSRDVTRGQLEAAGNGSWLGSAPYAYHVEGPRKNKRLVIDDPAKVRVVQRIFREYVEEGLSLHAIANRLNADGIASPAGKLKGWRWGSVKVLLQNPAYVGDHAGCRYAKGKYHSIEKGRIAKGQGYRRRAEEEWVVRRDHHEAVIDRVTFAKAQAILARGRTGRSPHQPDDNPYLLSCLLRCGRCDAVLHGTAKETGPNVPARRYYECSNKKHNGPEACLGTTVREDRVLRSVADHLDREFLALDGKGLAWKAERRELQPNDLPRAFAKMKGILVPPARQQTAADRKRAEGQIKELAGRIDKARRNLIHLDPEFISDAQQEIRRLEDERGRLEAELRRRPPAEQDINAETMAVLRSLYWLALFFRLTADPQDDAYLEEHGSALTGDFTPALRSYLRHVAGITVHARVEGQGTRTRYVFERGEIAFRDSLGNETGSRPGDHEASPSSPSGLVASLRARSSLYR